MKILTTTFILAFITISLKAQYYVDLWRSEYKVITLAPGFDSGIGDLAVKLNDSLIIFEGGHTEQNYNLWRTDGTAEGTYKIKDFDNIFSIRKIDDKVYIGAAIDNLYQVYESDGTKDGTVPTEEVSSHFMETGDYLNGIPFFQKSTIENNSWVHKIYFGGYTVETSEVELIGSMVEYLKLNNVIFFKRWSTLWRTDGTEVGTYNTGIANVDELFTIYKNKILLSIQSEQYGLELFISDGTKEGTKIVKDVDWDVDDSNPKDVYVFGEKFGFQANDGVDWHSDLYVSDGTPEGTVRYFSTNHSFDVFGAYKNLLFFENSGNLNAISDKSEEPFHYTKITERYLLNVQRFIWQDEDNIYLYGERNGMSLNPTCVLIQLNNKRKAPIMNILPTRRYDGYWEPDWMFRLGNNLVGNFNELYIIPVLEYENQKPEILVPWDWKQFDVYKDSIFQTGIFDFFDNDKDTISVSSYLVSGEPLPNWLNFEEAGNNFPEYKKYYFTGTPEVENNDTLNVVLEVNDNFGGKNADTIKIITYNNETFLDIGSSNTIKTNFYIYPNPSQCCFTISFGDNKSINFKLEVYNNLGMLMKTEKVSENLHKLELKGYPKGVYYLRFINQRVLFTKQILIE